MHLPSSISDAEIEAVSIGLAAIMPAWIVLRIKKAAIGITFATLIGWFVIWCSYRLLMGRNMAEDDDIGLFFSYAIWSFAGWVPALIYSLAIAAAKRIWSYAQPQAPAGGPPGA